MLDYRTATREQWKAQQHSNEPFPPWRLATWGERSQMVLVWVILLPVGIGMFVGIIAIIGISMENASQRNADHDRCMKHATNGYEIERCR
jgi:hypothetical protein